VRGALNKSLKRLGTGYVDLYLIHWPQATIEEWGSRIALPEDTYPTVFDTWRQMEALLSSGA